MKSITSSKVTLQQAKIPYPVVFAGAGSLSRGSQIVSVSERFELGRGLRDIRRRFQEVSWLPLSHSASVVAASFTPPRVRMLPEPL